MTSTFSDLDRANSFDRRLLAEWTQNIQPSSLQSLLQAGSHANVVSFAIGLPAAELFPGEAIAQATIAELAANPAVLQYAAASYRLKQHIVSLMQQRGVFCDIEQIFLTTGAQQGLSLLTHLLLNPGGKVLVEEITYMGLLRILNPLQPEIITVPTDSAQGIDVEAVEHMLQNGVRPAFLYLVADGHNPLGISLSLEKRKRLAELARLYRVPIIEDDPYGFLYYEGEGIGQPCLRAFEEQWVYYVGSFSKTLAPALRLGWVVVPSSLVSYLTHMKESQDLDTATLSQHIVAGLLDAGGFGQHLTTIRRAYKERRDVMHYALQMHLSKYAQWCKPTAGLFYWLAFSDKIDTTVLLQRALEVEHVLFTPGQFCFAKPNNDARYYARLCFTSCTPERIEIGIRRLAQAVEAMCYT